MMSCSFGGHNEPLTPSTSRAKQIHARIPELASRMDFGHDPTIAANRAASFQLARAWSLVKTAANSLIASRGPLPLTHKIFACAFLIIANAGSCAYKSSKAVQFAKYTHLMLHDELKLVIDVSNLNRLLFFRLNTQRNHLKANHRELCNLL